MMLRRTILAWIFSALIPLVSFSQYAWDFGGNVGASNYLGEMGGLEKTRRDFVKDLKWSQTRPAAGAFARYKFNQNISFKGSLNWMRIAGADSLSTNPGRAGRNLSFRNDIFEVGLELQYFIFTINDLGNTFRYRNDFRVYLSGGGAAYFHNPKAQLGDVWYNLRPYKTEGVSYSPFGFSLPAGMGFFFTIEKKYRIGWEFSWRTTFTDYIDDVSSVYIDPGTFGGDAIAASLANRRNELNDAALPHPNNYGPGSKRGDPTHKDSYMTTTVYFSYVIRGKSNFYRSKYGNLFGGSKYKRRRIRAKF